MAKDKNHLYVISKNLPEGIIVNKEKTEHFKMTVDSQNSNCLAGSLNFLCKKKKKKIKF
jgi:hypothetical protein